MDELIKKNLWQPSVEKLPYYSGNIL